MFFRKLTAIILMLAVGATSFQKAIFLLDYRINKNFIAAKLCINRNRPNSCCKGKCYLNKQLQKEETGNSGNPAPGSAKNTILLYVESPGNMASVTMVEMKYAVRYLYRECQPFVHSIFHPPGFIC
jgi:hypothetical protein